MKLNLGCGRDIKEGYVNIDINSFDQKVMKADIGKLDNFLNESVDEIFLSHVLEHFDNKDLRPILKEWNRILKKNGKIRIIVPNVIGAVKAFLENRLVTVGFARHYKNWSPEEIVFQMLYGRADILGDDKSEYDQHRTGFCYNRLKRFLEECGFQIIKANDETDTDQDLEVIAEKIKNI